MNHTSWSYCSGSILSWIGSLNPSYPFGCLAKSRNISCLTLRERNLVSTQVKNDAVHLLPTKISTMFMQSRIDYVVSPPRLSAIHTNSSKGSITLRTRHCDHQSLPLAPMAESSLCICWHTPAWIDIAAVSSYAAPLIKWATICYGNWWPTYIRCVRNSSTNRTILLDSFPCQFERCHAIYHHGRELVWCFYHRTEGVGGAVGWLFGRIRLRLHWILDQSHEPSAPILYLNEIVGCTIPPNCLSSHLPTGHDRWMLSHGNQTFLSVRRTWYGASPESRSIGLDLGTSPSSLCMFSRRTISWDLIQRCPKQVERPCFPANIVPMTFGFHTRHVPLQRVVVYNRPVITRN